MSGKTGKNKYKWVNFLGRKYRRKINMVSFDPQTDLSRQMLEILTGISLKIENPMKLSPSKNEIDRHQSRLDKILKKWDKLRKKYKHKLPDLTVSDLNFILERRQQSILARKRRIAEAHLEKFGLI